VRAWLRCAGALPAACAATAAARVRRHCQPPAGSRGAARVEVFIVAHYRAGRSLRELSELTDRSFSAVRNILSRHGVHRRAAGATPLHADIVPDSSQPSDVNESRLAGARLAGDGRAGGRMR
jgi:hypothetical protein